MNLTVGKNTLNVQLLKSSRVFEGWISGSSMYAGKLNQVNINYLTHLGYVSIQPHSTSDMTLEPDYGNLSHLTQIATYAHNADKKAGFSLWDNNTFPTIANNPTLLAQFVQNVVNLANTYHQDFIQIDSENSGATDAQRIKLAQALYIALHPLGINIGYYGVTIPFLLPIGLEPFIDWVEVVWNQVYSDRFQDYTNAMTIAVNNGWPKSKLNTLFMVYAHATSPSEIATYGDVVAVATQQGLDMNQSQGNVVNFNSSWYPTANYTGVLTWDGINLNKQKVAWILANGYGGVDYFCSDYDTIPNTSPLSLTRNVYEAFG